MNYLIAKFSLICLLFSPNVEAATTTKQFSDSDHAAKAVKNFFEAFGKGDMNGVISTFHENVVITAVRSGNRTAGQLYGSYLGKAGAKEFLSNMGQLFDTKAFEISNIVGKGDVAFANGKFSHIIKSSGKTFSSDWALMCVIKDGKILEYHFYEDSAAFEQAK